MPKVSVVIPTYNRANRLSNAIRSVLAQTEMDFEVLVADDGSADDGAEAVVRAHRDQRLHYIRLPAHRGAAAARNAGITRAVAPYIGFLDDDDEWLPRKLEIQVAALDRSAPSVGGIYTGRFNIHETTGHVTRVRCEAFSPASGQNPIATPTLLIRRKCFDEVGLFDEELETGEDLDMWIRVSRAFRFDCIDEPLVKVYVHERSLSQDYSRWTGSMERLLQKHRSVFASDRRALCSLHVKLGAWYCHTGKVAKARRAFLTAMWLWPLEPRGYFNLALSLLGSEGFKRVSAMRAARAGRQDGGGLENRGVPRRAGSHGTAERHD